MTVVVCGLKGRPELNGCSAEVLSWDDEKGRYNVSITGRQMALKAENLMA